jgi:transcription elongation factor GreA
MSSSVPPDSEPISAEGLDALKRELADLMTSGRRAIAKRILVARELGDLSENAEYHAAKERQAFIEGRVAELEDKIARAEVIDVSKLSGSIVRFGATVTLVDEDTDEKVTYQIVGADEGDIAKGLLSITAPLARALIGKTKGDSVEVSTPGGSKAYEITRVVYK